MKYICVFCGSRTGINPNYEQTASNLGKMIAQKGLGIVYGAGKSGLMGAVAKAALTAGGQVVGVIPDFLSSQEPTYSGLTKLHIVDSMHERKALMAKLADAFIILPGGYGTLEEFCEILTWAQLALHQKPIILLNINGYYDPLLKFFDQAVQEKFLLPQYRSLVQEVTSLEELQPLIK
ncbi:MAG: TIGR00730 family Rossman fold protein [Spirulinaceae cyanobacterium]